jgi:DNA (cytosine-5)-methyltransferase 1
MRAIDLFAGVGGVRLGFEKAGFNTVFANDFEPACKETYDLNSDEASLTVADINKLKISDLPEFDLLLGGFPCQAFSIAGYRKGFDDDKGRGDLFFRISEIIKECKPKAFFLENVKNLKTHDKGKTFKVIKKTLEDLGYHVKSAVLNSMTHGNIPQNRERIFIVGFLDKKSFDKFKFPKEVDLTINFRELLEKSVDGKYYYNGKTLYSRLKDDVNSKDKVYQWRRRYVRENKSGVVPTLTANMGTGGHNVPIILDDKGIRKLTPKECFLMQGFPKDFKLPEMADSKLYQQAGNSVSVPVVERIAKEIRKAL